MTVLLPRDENASRDIDAPKAAKTAPDGNFTKNQRNIDAPHIAKARAKPNVAPNTNTKKVFIKTYGCQMNVYDSERMADVLSLIHISEPTRPY